MCVTNPAGGSFGQLLEPSVYNSSDIIREFRATKLLCQPGDTELPSQVVPFLTDQGHALDFHNKKFQEKWSFSSPLISIPQNLSPLSNNLLGKGCCNFYSMCFSH